MVYKVEYTLWKHQLPQRVFVAAKSKYQAWDKAVYEEIPKVEGELPYSAWVASVTYNNGNYKEFNNHQGKPY